jgi:guanylate kinase
MGRIFTLSGPSGVGKTTFLLDLFRTVDRSKLRLLARYTDRPIRHDEQEGFEHFFTSHQGMLQKLSANDFIHIEKWGDYYSGIETRILNETLKSPHDGIILASTFGAARLKATYSSNITCLYMWCHNRASLLNPRCLEAQSPEITELKWRIRKKLTEEGFSEFETASLTDDAFLQKRLVDNYLDIAAIDGRLRSGEEILVLPNLRDRMAETVSSFIKLWEHAQPADLASIKSMGGGCFVLMPFKAELRPVYEDHISKVCKSMNMQITRADQIFSNRPIMDDILESVKTARFIVADLTGGNPNVFYETGICHALGKEVILITQDKEVPFDLRYIRHLRYSYTPRGMAQFEEALHGTFEALLSIDRLTDSQSSQ